MKEILLKSLKLYGKCIVGSIMCFVLVITLNVIGNALFTDTIGYTMWGAPEGQEKMDILYEHKLSDGDDLKEKEYLDNGYTLNKVSILSQMKLSTKIGWFVVCEIFLVFMMGVFVYNDMWKLGFKDNNLVRIGAKPEDKLKGLKIGLLTMAPAFILLTFLAIGAQSYAANVSIATYAFINPHLYDAIILLTPSGNGGIFSDLNVWHYIVNYVLLFIVPLIAFGAYLLGYKSILVSEKLIYKKK